MSKKLSSPWQRIKDQVRAETVAREADDPNRRYVEHDFNRALIGTTSLVAANLEELERLCLARPNTRHMASRVRDRDWKFIRYKVLEKLKEYSTDDNYAKLNPDAFTRTAE
jgi:hypothetical protein